MAETSVVGILRAMLTADTASFDTGMRKAEQTTLKVGKSISGLEKEVAKLTPQAERMVKSLGGDKLLYTANSLTQAITKLGGATKLTEAEQVRANRTLADAIAKYTAMGQTAPKAMVDLERETRKAVPSMLSLGSAISSIGAAMAASFSVGAVIGFVRSMGQFAGEMKDLSAETAIGVEQLQALNYVGAGVGLTIQNITQSATMLADRLGSGDKSAIAALGKMGIAAADLKGQRLDEVLFRIGDGAKTITDQNERIAIFRDLFGRSGSQMLRLYEEDLRSAAIQAAASGAVISKELIDKADEFDDRWSQAILKVKAGLVSVSDAWLTPPGAKAEQAAAQWARMIDDLAKKAGRPQSSILGSQGIVTPAITEAETKAILAQSAALMEAAEAAIAYRAAVKRLYEDIGGATASKSVQQLNDAWLMLAPTQRANAAIVSDVLKRYEALRKEVGTNLVPALEQLFVTTGTLTNSATDLRDAIAAIAPAVTAASDSLEGRMLPSGTGVDELFASAERARKSREELERLGMIAPQIVDGNERVSESIDQQGRSWGELGERLKRVSRQFSDAAIGNIGTLLFGFGDDTRELKRVADEAEQDYLRIKRSGKATAEELTLAFRRFHEAEERANHGFAERFKDVWQGIKTSLQNVLNEILQFFTEKFLVGIVKGLAGARLGQGLGGLLGGGGGGGGGGLLGMAGNALPGLLGGGGGAVAAGNTVYGTGIAGMSGGGAAGGGAGAGGFLTNPAFWTNPWTIAGIGAAALLTWGIKKKGWFRGGEEGVVVNPLRDKFLAQFGGPGTGHDSGFANLAARLTKFTGEPGGGRLHAALRAADTKKEFQSAEDGIIAEFARHGIRNVKKFNLGGFVPPGAVVPAILHGGSHGEMVTPLSKMGGGAITIINQNHWSVSGMDGESIGRVVQSPEFAHEVAAVFERNANFLTTRVQRALAY